MSKEYTENLIGQKFNKLTVIERAPNTNKSKSKPHGYVAYYCNCDCGIKNILVSANNLKNSNTKSCGCIKSETENLVGKIFGKLTVVKKVPNIGSGPRRMAGYVAFACNCVCGNSNVIIKAKDLKSGHSQSCGCSNIETKYDLVGRTFEKLTVIGRVNNIGQTQIRPEGFAAYNCNCSCGATNIIVRGQFLKNGTTRSCGCISKINEAIVGRVLRAHNISYEQQKRLKHINKNFPNFIIDYCISNNIFIEYNGIQHYIPVNYGNMSDEEINAKFEAQLIRDAQLKTFCNENGYTLIIIDGSKYFGNKLKKYIDNEIIPLIITILKDNK